MMVVIPDNLNPAYAKNATIYVTGNSNESGSGTGVPEPDDFNMGLVTTLATGVGMPAAALYQVIFCNLI